MEGRRTAFNEGGTLAHYRRLFWSPRRSRSLTVARFRITLVSLADEMNSRNIASCRHVSRYRAINIDAPIIAKPDIGHAF